MGHSELLPPTISKHLVSMPALRRSHWTVDEVDRLAEEHREPVPRFELVDGELLVGGRWRSRGI